MTTTIDLTGDIALAVTGAAERGHTMALGYIDSAGYPVVSFRGSTVVHGPQQLAVWARNPDSGFAAEVATRPEVSLVYYGGPDSPGAMFLSFRGRAHVDPSVNDAVYAAMIEGERGLDPDRKGVAVIIDVEGVRGVGPDGPIAQGA